MVRGTRGRATRVGQADGAVDGHEHGSEGQMSGQRSSAEGTFATRTVAPNGEALAKRNFKAPLSHAYRRNMSILHAAYTTKYPGALANIHETLSIGLVGSIEQHTFFFPRHS